MMTKSEAHDAALLATCLIVVFGALLVVLILAILKHLIIVFVILGVLTIYGLSYKFYSRKVDEDVG